jgi:hypothetical protein
VGKGRQPLQVVSRLALKFLGALSLFRLAFLLLALVKEDKCPNRGGCHDFVVRQCGGVICHDTDPE